LSIKVVELRAIGAGKIACDHRFFPVQAV